MTYAAGFGLLNNWQVIYLRIYILDRTVGAQTASSIMHFGLFLAENDKSLPRGRREEVKSGVF